MPNYDKIDNAQVMNKYPFHQEHGNFIVVIQNWIGRETRQQGFCDFVDWKVIKVLNGDRSCDGALRTRMRIWSRDGSAEEVKQRIQAAYSSTMQALTPGEVFPVSSINGAMIQKIHQDGGRDVLNYPIKIQVDSVQTKAGKPFTAITYSVPTATDLEGLKLDELGRFIG